MARYESRGEAIKDLRKSKGLSQEELATLLDTTKQTIYKYETGIITNIPSDKIEAMSQIFGVSPAIIMCWDTNPPIYEAAAGKGRLNDGYPDETYSVKLEADQFLFSVKGQSMEPTLQDGDVVIVNQQNTLDHANQIALVKINGEESTLKRVEIQSGGIILIGDNPAVFPPRFYSAEQVEQMPVRIEGVVVKLIREL